jgi:hypothetical protein
LSEEEQDVALAPLVERGIARQSDAPAAGPPRLPPSIQVAHMLLSGRSVEDAARLEGVPEHVIEATLRDVASRPGAEPALVSLLSLVAEGRSPSQARRELDLSKDDFAQILRQLMGAETSHPAQFFPAASPGGPQRVVPVRFPEPQYDRLKQWCATHGFPMAAVVRGLVERFLDEQDRRAT